MNLNKLINLAKKNEKESINQKKIGYSTGVTAPKKLEKTVNPNAVKAFLDRKKEIEKIKAEEKLKKKRDLEKLREEKKHTKKAKAMATRTKDNLQIYRGEDYLGRNKNKEKETVLTPEQEMLQKSFMRKITSAKDISLDSDQSDNDRKVKKTKKVSAKKKKRQEKARSAAKLNFNDLLNLAQTQTKSDVEDSSSSSDDSTDTDSSDEEANSEEKYERERRKRKQLEAELKAMKSMKRKLNGGGAASAPFKIAKLDKSLSEDDKKAKVKALMMKFNTKSHTAESTDSSLDRRKDSSRSKSAPVERKKHSDKSVPNHRKHSKNHSFAKSHDRSSIPNHKNPTSNHKQESRSLKPNSTLDKRKGSPQPKNGYSSKHKDTVKKSDMSKYQIAAKVNMEKNKKKALNPYAEILEKAKHNSKPPPSCTLSVQSTVVRTNYPGVSQTDPKKPTYGKPEVPSRAMLEEYRRRSMLGRSDRHPPPRRAQVLRDDYDDEDEYDSEMEGFIDDDEGDSGADISAQIGAIFGYDKSKYGRESEYELSKMDASFKDIEREEKRSLRIAQQEDALEAKRLEEEEERKKKRRKR